MLGLALFGKKLGFLIVDSTLAFHVGLIPGNDNYDFFVIGMISEFSHPLLNLFKRLSRDDFIDDDGPESIPVVDRSNRIILLLASSVPNSQLHFFVMMLQLRLFPSSMH